MTLSDWSTSQLAANRRTRARRRRTTAVLLASALLASLLPSQVAHAATSTVCAVGCDHSSIQAAINAGAPADTILLAGETFSETISVDRNLTIQGTGAALSTIDGGGAGSVISVLPGVSVRLDELAVRGGSTAGHGGGIFNEGALVADAVLISGNVATTVASSAGGGIYSTGQLTLTNSTVSGNQSQVGGGGIYVSGPSATALIEDSQLTGNVVRDLTTDFRGGGALHIVHGDATVNRTRIVENSTDFTGGGVTVRGSSSDVEIVDSTISGNTSTFGAGIITQSSSRLTVRGSTISNNTAGRGGAAVGGGLRASAPVTITNSTFIGNAAVAGGTFNSAGGAISAQSTVTLDSVTIAANSADFGGGVASFSGTTLVTNSILAGNTAEAAANGNDCGGTLAGGEALLIGDATGCTFSAVTGVVVGDPLLGPLQDNGGLTLTLEPQSGSPAIDAGSTTLTSDQRGFVRPVGSAPDIGAVEVQSAGAGAPEIEPIADRFVDEGQPIEIMPVVTDPEGDPFSLSWDGLPAGSSTAGGTFSWTPDEAQGPGSYAIAVRATQDGAPALFDEETFTINVAEVNQPPTLGGLTDASVAPGDTVGFGLNATDPDIPPNDLTFTLIEGPAGATLDPTTGAFSWLACGCPGDHPVEVSVSDGDLSDTAGATITVTDGTAAGGHFFPLADSPSIGWQARFPMGELDTARLRGEVVVIASAGTADQVLQALALDSPTAVDIDGGGTNDIMVTVSLAPGPGISPAVVLSIDRLAAPGLQDVQVIALVPLPEEMSTAIGKASLAVGVGTAAAGGGAGGYLPESEVITASVDEIGGLAHRIQLRFETTNELNPLIFYMGTAEGNARDLGATAATLLAVQTSPVPSQVDLSLGVDVGALTAPEPAIGAVLEWNAPTGEPDPDATFFYLESERVPRGTAADVDLRGVVEGIDPVTRLTMSLVPDESLELALYHNDPSNDPPAGTRWDTIDRVQLEYHQPGLDLRAALVGLVGPDFVLTIDDGTGDLAATNSSRFELEFEVSRPGRGFFGSAFSSPLDWIFVSASDFSSLTISDSDGGGSDVAFSDMFGPGSDLIFVAADDPAALRFPIRQQSAWPSTHPSQWPRITSGQQLVRLGLVDDADGTTLAIRTNDTPSLTFDFSPDSLTQTIALNAAYQTMLDVDIEFGPRPAMAEGALLGCNAILSMGAVAIDIQPPGTYGFVSGGGADLDCYGENSTRSLVVTAQHFPERMTAELHTAGETGELVFTGADGNLADDPVDDLRIRLTDTADGLTGDEPLGAPAQLLDLRAAMLPSTRISWAHRGEGDLGFEVLATSVEERIHQLTFMLVTIPEAIDVEGEPVFSPSFEPPPRGPGQRPFMPAREISVYLWELSEMTMLAAGVDFGRRLAATVGADGAATVELELGDDAVTEMPLVVDLALPEGGHFLPAASVHGWCDLMLPLSTVTFKAALPDSASLGTSAAAPFSSLSCRQRISKADLALDADVLVDAHVLPDGTSLSMDLAVGTVTLSAGSASIADLIIDVQDRSTDGLPGEAPFAHPIGALGVRVDEAQSLTASWLFQASPRAGVPGRLLIDMLTLGAEAVQFRATTDTDPDPLSTVPATHRFHLVEEGADGIGLAHLTLLDLRHAQILHDPALELPLNVEVGTVQMHDLALDIHLDFDSPLTLTSPRTDTPYQIDAIGFVSDVASTVLFSTNLEDRHVVDGAIGADLSAHIELDDDPTDEEDGDPVLEVYLVATDLPAGLGLNAYNFDPQSQAGEPLYIELTTSLPMLDVVLLDPRDDGVLETGSNRIRVHAEGIPSSLEFELDNQISDDGTGTINFRGVASGRIDRLLFESDDIEIGTHESHFDTQFARITADLFDVPPEFAAQVQIGTVPNIEDARSLRGALTFSDGPISAAGPDVNDRIGRVEVILEASNPGMGEDRGQALLTYADDGFTSLERSQFVRGVDDAYWPAGVRGRLNLSEAGFALLTTPIAPTPAADGQAGSVRTHAIDDYVILGNPTYNGWDLIAVQVSNVHRVTVDSAAPELEAQVLRPTGTVAPALYLAVESEQLATYEGLPKKPKAGRPDKDAPVVADDGAAYLYTGAPRDEAVIDVLANDPDLSAAANFIVSRQPEHGRIGFEFRTVRGEQRRVLVYEPIDPHRLGWDLAMYMACTAAGACAEARVDILITDQYVGGVFGRIVGPPNDLSVSTTGHVELRVGELSDEGMPVYSPVIDRLGYSAGTAPTGIDLYSGPRIQPPKSIVPALRVHALSAPTSLTWHATRPDAYLFRYKADAVGPFDLAGVVRTERGLTRFGAKGSGGFELAGAANGFIGQAITGERTPEEFRGCDRIFGKIDTCVAIIGINVEGTADARLDGYFSYGPPTETTEVARQAGAADFEYVPLITLLIDDLRRISGGAQLQFDPIRLGSLVSGPFQVESGIRVTASQVKLDLWARGAVEATLRFATAGTFPIPLGASYVSNTPFSVLGRFATFDPYQ